MSKWTASPGRRCGRLILWSALIACLTAFLLLLEAPRHTGAGRWKYAALGGIAVASCVGASIYIAFVFGAFLLLLDGGLGCEEMAR